MSTLNVGTIKSITNDATVFQKSNGLEIGQLAKAWVSFNGNSESIFASFNISSVAENATGVYTVNIDNNFDAATYCVVVTSGSSTQNDQTSQNSQLFAHSERSAGVFKIRHGNTENNSNTDCGELNAVCFGAN